MGDWRLLLDENIDPSVATILHDREVDVMTVGETVGLGATDTAIRAFARQTQRIIVTSDVRDFAPLAPDAHAGVVLVHDDTMSAQRIATGLQSMIEAYPGRESFPAQETLDDWV